MNNFIGIKRIGQNKKAMEKLLKVKSLSSLKGELQKVFNEFIRHRDTIKENGKSFFICISCGEPKDLSHMNAGHLYPVGSNDVIRYDEDNCWGQCIACNLHKHGNQLEFYKRLIAKIGKERVERLEIRRHNLSKMARFEVELLIEQYREKVKLLKG